MFTISAFIVYQRYLTIIRKTFDCVVGTVVTDVDYTVVKRKDEQITKAQTVLDHAGKIVKL